MLEAGAKLLPEEKILSAIKLAHEENSKIIKAISEIQKEVGAEKFVYTPVAIDQDLLHEVEKAHKKDLEPLVAITGWYRWPS
jgi:polyribonucleotide nucleotidyltransferase